jgi:hypothetical protein
VNRNQELCIELVVTNSQVLSHNGSLLHSLFNTQLLITVSSSITHVRTLQVLSHNCPVHSKSLLYISHGRIHSNVFRLVLRYYGNATNSLLCNRHCYVTMEMPQGA